MDPLLAMLYYCQPLWRKYCHLTKFFVTGCTGRCQYDNVRWNQWRKFRQNAFWNTFSELWMIARKRTFCTKGHGPCFLIVLTGWSVQCGISVAWCKKDVTPLLMHWSYVLLELTHRHDTNETYHVIWLRRQPHSALVYQNRWHRRSFIVYKLAYISVR